MFALVEEWAHKNGMIFDPGKFEAIHFSQKCCFPNPEIVLPPAPQTENGTGTRIIKPIEKNSSMRWLGVYFDTRISFAHHISKMATKGHQATAGLAMLGNTTRGADPGLMRRAVHACILPILTYGAPAWWPGRVRKNKDGRDIQNGVDGHCRKLDKSQNVALCTIIPVWKTTPVKILQREVATPPIHHSLDYLCELSGIRMHRLESKHPLRRKTKNAYTSSRPTRLERIAQKCSAIVEFSDPLLDSEPWETHLFGG